MNIFRRVYGSFSLRFQPTEGIYAAYDLVDRVKSTDPKQIMHKHYVMMALAREIRRRKLTMENVL